MSSYRDFLARKSRLPGDLGASIRDQDIHPSLHQWQREVVRWAVRAGRAAIWADTGTGKTRMQIEWARASGRRPLIVAPLAVCHQTVDEAAKIGVMATYVRTDADTGHEPGMWVTNYEMVEHFDPKLFDAVVLDEASILKNHEGKTRTKLIAHFAETPRRLACTATPAPNDPQELTNQAEFLGRSTRAEMLAAYFIHDGDGWRPKGHAKQPMFRWLASWAVALRRPSDLGYPDDGYILPDLSIVPHMVATGDVQLPGELFPVAGKVAMKGVTGRAAVRKATVAHRVDRAVEIVKNEPEQPWLLWAGRNDEADQLAAAKTAETMGLPTDSEWLRQTVSEDLFMIPGPTWYGIKETATLNERVAREEADERHICPLQLEFIERCVRLWSNKGETVLSPFAGIGSEVYVAATSGRRGVGVELKSSYWRSAVDNLRRAESESPEPQLF